MTSLFVVRSENLFFQSILIYVMQEVTRATVEDTERQLQEVVCVRQQVQDELLRAYAAHGEGHDRLVEQIATQQVLDLLL